MKVPRFTSHIILIQKCIDQVINPCSIQHPAFSEVRLLTEAKTFKQLY